MRMVYYIIYFRNDCSDSVSFVVTVTAGMRCHRVFMELIDEGYVRHRCLK